MQAELLRRRNRFRNATAKMFKTLDNMGRSECIIYLLLSTFHALGHTFGHPLHFLFDYPFKNPRSTPAHKDAVWSCSDPHEKAWDSVKKLISVPPVSHYYQSAEQLEIPCDSSQSGLGAALIHNGQPIAYASRTFTETESL